MYLQSCCILHMLSMISGRRVLLSDYSLTVASWYPQGSIQGVRSDVNVVQCTQPFVIAISG